MRKISNSVVKLLFKLIIRLQDIFEDNMFMHWRAFELLMFAKQYLMLAYIRYENIDYKPCQSKFCDMYVFDDYSIVYFYPIRIYTKYRYQMKPKNFKPFKKRKKI
jgi:hypothetical protein